MRKIEALVIFALFIVFIFSFNLQASAQERKEGEKEKFEKTPAPADEEFQLIDGVLVHGASFPGRYYYEFSMADIYRLYNADKTVWYEFSFDEKSPVWFKKHKKDEFRPMRSLSNSSVYLRVKAESKNWYEIFVNEEYQETKYFWKGDRLLGYRSFEYWFEFSPKIYLDKEKNPLRETPDGKITNIQGNSPTQLYRVLKIEGDWLFVRSERVSEAEGWIRWREGRKILIGWFFNKYEVPEQ